MAADLLTRLASETAAGLELAALERRADALAAARAGRAGAAVYLAGYAVEMLLKWASFRVVDPGGVHPVGTLLGTARGLAGTGVVPQAWQSGHNLLFWLQYLRAKRAVTGLASLPCDLQLDAYVGWWVRHWRVEMRYVPWSAATSREAARFIQRVRWLERQRSTLWR